MKKYLTLLLLFSTLLLTAQDATVDLNYYLRGGNNLHPRNFQMNTEKLAL